MDDTAASALFAWLDRELWLATACADDKPGGLIASFVSPVSIVPEMPRVMIAVGHQHFTWQLIEKSQAFALHLLGKDNLPWIRRFGLESGHEVDKFASLTWSTSETGSPILDHTIGWMDCRVEASTSIGDRTVLIGEVIQSRITCYGPPLTLKQVLEESPSDVHSEMRQQLHQDIVLSGDAIAQWRSEQRERSTT